MQIQIFVPASVRFGEREAYTLLRARGVPAQDAIRALQQKRGDRHVKAREVRDARVGALQ